MSAVSNGPGRGVASVAGARRGFRLAPLAQGFRPFFLLAGIWALLGVALWASALAGMAVPDGPLPLVRWHGHEMLVGFVGAAMVGFLLTAVPNWTGRRGHAGAPLAILLTVILAGRLALLPGSPLSTGLAAAIALLGLPMLLLLLLPSLVKARQPRLFGPPLIVLVFWGGDLLMLGGAAGWWAADTWRLGQLLSANAALALVGLIGGRIVPSFTLNALRKTGRPAEPSPLPGIDRAAVLSLLGVLLIDLVLPDSVAAGGVAALAAILVGLRLSRWHGLRTLGVPIVWVLHLAYAFVPLSLATKAAFLLAGAPWAMNWLHLQGAGALALMIVAVMTRAALGHTGRDLVAAPATVVAYVLIALAALMRCFGPPLTGGALAPLMVAGALWVAAFALYLMVYAPVLLLTRPDGKPG
ncbi:NnrS family protein [Neoroseomonas lacus]|uniref:Protein NnrS n=1 Tax=Neoroseomonas lacus TaxID=287609 RepID=A0A917NYZ4_9PROT|nr:NnrS family protein [Neoroseomonas lacus]GGJ42099.1 protein NnrS [Neoroseomonas lacus]